MGRKSTVAVLDEAIVAQVGLLIRKGRTIDEILVALEELGADVSRSAVGRFVKSERESMRQYAKAQGVARVWVEQFGAEPDGDVARLLPQMLEAVAHRTLEDMSESEEIKSPEEVRVMARALKDLSGAKAGNINIELKLREVREADRLKVQAESKQAANEVEKTVRQAGLSEVQVQAIRNRILGIGEQA
nr:phage protein Gp27 family protein [uncultured Albidiferax sp.]